jgi:hypothetical protein
LMPTETWPSPATASWGQEHSDRCCIRVKGLLVCVWGGWGGGGCLWTAACPVGNHAMKSQPSMGLQLSPETCLTMAGPPPDSMGTKLLLSEEAGTAAVLLCIAETPGLIGGPMPICKSGRKLLLLKGVFLHVPYCTPLGSPCAVPRCSPSGSQDADRPWHPQPL